MSSPLELCQLYPATLPSRCGRRPLRRSRSIKNFSNLTSSRRVVSVSRLLRWRTFTRLSFHNVTAIVGLKKRHPPAVHVANHPAASTPSGRSVTADSEISSRCASSKRSTSAVSAAARQMRRGCGRGAPKSRNPTNRIPAQMLRQGRLYTSFSSCLIPSILPSSSASTLS